MKNRLLLAFLPLVGLLFLAAASYLGGEEVWLALTGRRTTGQIVGVLKVRATEAEYVGAINHRIVFSQADGHTLMVEAKNYALTAFQQNGRSLPLEHLRAGAPPVPGVPDGFADLAAKTIAGDTAILRRLVQQQQRAATAEHIVRIEKTETASVWCGLAPGIHRFSHDPDRGVWPTAAAPGAAVEVVTRAVIVEPTLNQKTRQDLMIEYERTVGGRPTPTHRNDFILYDEPYATAQIPVFAYQTARRFSVLLSDLGRHGPPTLAFPVFGKCAVIYEEAHPENALLMPQIDRPAGRLKLLDWFSKTCESIFSRWAYVALLGVGSALALCAAGLVFSLHRQNPVD